MAARQNVHNAWYVTASCGILTGVCVFSSGLTVTITREFKYRTLFTDRLVGGGAVLAARRYRGRDRHTGGSHWLACVGRSAADSVGPATVVAIVNIEHTSIVATDRATVPVIRQLTGK